MGKIVGLVFREEIKKFACPHCEKEYTTEEGLARHMKDKHPEEGNPDTGDD